VVPEIDELHDEDLITITSAVISGVKFYLNDTLHSPEDSSATNYDFLRWHQKKQELRDDFPTVAFSITNRTKENAWL
jgi:hypothetical protein